MTRTWFEVRLGRVHRRSSSHRGRGRPDRCIHGVLGSRRGDRQVLFVVGAVGTQSAGWVGSTHLVLMGTALCGLALWVVCWSVSAGVRLSLIHISEPTRLGMISYAVFCLKKKKLPRKQVLRLLPRPQNKNTIHQQKTT